MPCHSAGGDDVEFYAVAFADLRKGTRYRFSLLDVQNRANLHETEHPELTAAQAKEAPNTYTDKDFTTTLFKLLDERGWL